jgi:hypothetical protein
LEHLSDASFLGKLLELPANVRLDRKVNASYEHYLIWPRHQQRRKKSFITLTPGR